MGHGSAVKSGGALIWTKQQSTKFPGRASIEVDGKGCIRQNAISIGVDGFEFGHGDLLKLQNLVLLFVDVLLIDGGGSNALGVVDR